MTVDHGRDERLPLTVADERVAVALEAVATYIHGRITCPRGYESR